MSIQAVKSMVIIKVHHKEQSGLVYIPDQSKAYNADFYGEVIDVGPDVMLDIVPGDKIMYYRHEGFPIDVDGEEYFALRSSHIMGIIKEGDDEES